MSGNNRMRVAVAGALAASVLGSGLALAPQAEAATLKSKAYSVAVAQKGDPYRLGAEGPNRFDCSGLVHYAYRKAGYDWKGKRLTAQGQYNKSKHIAKSDRKPGDLVFFGGSSSIYHVGFYAGNGYVWHAPYTGAVVRKEKIWTKYVKYGRLA